MIKCSYQGKRLHRHGFWLSAVQLCRMKRGFVHTIGVQEGNHIFNQCLSVCFGADSVSEDHVSSRIGREGPAADRYNSLYAGHALEQW